MSKVNRAPKVHSKPDLMAAIVVYYGSILAGEPINLKQSEKDFREMGINMGVLRRCIARHNKEIEDSGCPSEIVHLLTKNFNLKEPKTKKNNNTLKEAIS